jgi:gamma-glutamylcyclotransferase (GGCT)/AIG2-like uncharacterized protein YtfP
VGEWIHPGYARAGRLGADLGYPALILDPEGPSVDVQVFESVEPPGHWSRLDEFEGPGYQRVVATVETTEG